MSMCPLVELKEIRIVLITRISAKKLWFWVPRFHRFGIVASITRKLLAEVEILNRLDQLTF